MDLFAVLQEDIAVWYFHENAIDQSLEDFLNGKCDGWFQFIENIAPILIQKQIHIVTELLITIEQIFKVHVQSCRIEIKKETLRLNVLFAIFLNNFWLIFNDQIGIVEHQIRIAVT